MGFEPIFDARYWSAVPFHFWSLVFFVLGSMVGSFLNVVIYRLPIGQSIISPPSHCPHCKYSIPWYLNMPLITWLYLNGKCRNCKALISVRYFLVEILTGALFLCAWMVYGHAHMGVAFIYCILLAGLIASTFIDFDHFIIPDELTIGGMVVGLSCSILVPTLHQQVGVLGSMFHSILGMMVGGGVIYLILRMGKLLFGRQRIELPSETRIVFSETCVHLPDKDIPYEDLFYRKSDTVALHARTVELADRCYRDVIVRLAPDKLMIGDEQLDPEAVPHLEAISTEIVLPREAMGFGDVKFMAAIGAFLGWQATLFSLMVSSLIGSIVGVGLIVMGRREWSSRLPYGPYIAAAAVIWMFGGDRLLDLILHR
jgi:leader peptidase (prepilin peptidase)/N-methyltransferase